MPIYVSIRESVNIITREMLRCAEACPGVSCNISKGVVPRGLYLEPGIDPKAPGAIICGLNPGRVKRKESAFYVGGDLNVRYKEYFDRHLVSSDYFKLLRNFARETLQVSGPLLFTDTVKCEKSSGVRAFNHATSPTALRTCTDKYLRRELALCPPDWLALGAGREAFISLCHLATERLILGVYHPTGSWQLFPRFSNDLDPVVVRQIIEKNRLVKNAAIWLPSETIK